ncbi:MAG: phosphoenolpyruvate synthase [Saprospiraceae bacterium]|nr:phosphoenolpyruvate synthase [Saprospiraceae bacterium]
MKNLLLCFTFCFLFSNQCHLQHTDLSAPVSEIQSLINLFKSDVRGPYKDIRWFCPDGSVIPPKEKCKDPGGYQKARHKDEVVRLAEKHHLYFGQILKGTENKDFYDIENDHSRLKQYILGQYLQSIDDGWINRKGRYYRGAVQAEDEEDWGRSFLTFALDDARFSSEKYFLIREASKFIPHGEQSNLLLDIRSLSKNIADRQPSFMDIRTKIHGRPAAEDIVSTKAYKTQKANSLKDTDIKELDQLIKAMEQYYSTDLSKQLAPYLKRIPSEHIKSAIKSYQETIPNAIDTEEKIIRSVDLLSLIRQEIESKHAPSTRLSLMDVSLIIEGYTIRAIPEWSTETIKDELKLGCYLSELSYATGYIYKWEYDELTALTTTHPEEGISLDMLLEIFRAIRRNINWGSGLIITEFGEVIDLYSSFEPLSHGFIDDRIRSSALLFMGQLASRLNEFMADKAGWETQVIGKKSSTIQGINPGYARGKLMVVEQLEENKVDPGAIYVFKKSPADLEPVAGILSISEGNMVSHLQLLARNLGIPNANISESDYSMFQTYEGKEVFYAVSNKGGVLIKLAEEMNDAEKQLFARKTVDEEVIRVPTEELVLDNPKIYKLNDIDASSSGKLCGPKAANFARLKQLFPDNLVNGLVIPFAIFKDHMEEMIPGEDISYWQHLGITFDEISRMRSQNQSIENIETYTFNRLEALRTYIKTMNLKASFIEELENQFAQEFGRPIGQVPVFLRSDTNMEDLKDFTGAGLNLTVFNTIEREKILQGIRDVWASPYTERSYRWRQKFLSNPEDVYPSILVIPSVFVDYSGVIITKDFIEGGPDRLNVAFSQGVGGAVDGQKAESWILDPKGTNILVSPARDRKFKTLSRSGGTMNQEASLAQRILTNDNIQQVWKICETIYSEMPKAGMTFPYDIELGFENDHLWLFQIRPFVENKKALSSNYLSQLDPVVPLNLKFDMNEKVYQ